ncbi:hypothetical protein KCU73_g9401, partial [Aureobasidium melanogenum]
MPTLKPNNRDKFWSKNRRDLDRIGWTGKYIYSDSEDESEEESCQDDKAENTSFVDYWNDIDLPGHSEDPGFVEEGEDNDGDGEEILSGGEGSVEEGVMEVIAALVFFIVVQGGVYCIVQMIL